MRSFLTTLVIAIALVVPVAAFAPAVGATDAAWQQKLGPSLSEALEGNPDYTRFAEDGLYPVLVTGPQLPSPDVAPATRDAWNAYWADAFAPWADDVLAHADRVIDMWPAATTAKVLLTEDEIELVAQHPSVITMELDHDGAVTLVEPEAPVTGMGAGDSIPQTGAPTFWENGFKGEGVLLAIIDTGIDAAHPMLKDALNGCGNRVVKWNDQINGRSTPYDDHGHGTHVAGTAAGTTACGGQLNGVAPNAPLMGVKILSGSGGGSWEGAMDGVQWAFDNGADVTSNSWGGSCSSGRAVANLFNTLAEAGMESAIAAGNSGSGGIGCPGDADLVVTVGAVDLNKNIASFSSRGPCSDGRTCPDVVAVGVDVTSSFPGGGMRTWSGTSMATPHVGGAGALMTQATRTLTGRDLFAAKAEGFHESEFERLLKMTAQDLGPAGEDNAYGWGYIQLTPIFHDIVSRSRAQVNLVTEITDVLLENDDVTDVTVALKNIGGMEANGRFMVTLTGPEGATTLADEPLDVPALAEVTRSYAFGALDLRPGAYTVDVMYGYAWTNPITGAPESDTLTDTVAFEVKRADLRVTKVLAPSVMPGESFDVTITVENVGNLPGTTAEIVDEIPGAYVVTPRTPGSTLGSMWASEDPETKTTNLDFSTSFVWNVGDVDAGESWSVTYTLTAYQPGTFTHVTELAYGNNGIGRIVEQHAADQTIGL